MSNDLICHQEEAVLTLGINRPNKRNALNGMLISHLLKKLLDAKNDASIRVILIYGVGEHFCSGADIDWMKKISTLSFQDNLDDAEQLATLLYELYTFPKPSICIAKGSTFGGGLGLLAASDIALADATAYFQFSEIKIGLMPAIISPYIVSCMGERQAYYYFLTAKPFTSHEAHKVGLIQEITNEDAYVFGLDLAKQLSLGPPNVQRTIKPLLNEISRKPIDSTLIKTTAHHLAKQRATTEGKEGLTAFLEKRSPIWK